jgi:hypothetical protein
VTDDTTLQPLLDSKHWESECAKNPSYSRCNAGENRQDLFLLWKH